MSEKMKDKELMHEHTHHAIQKRLSEKAQPSYLGDFMLGSIDGLVTTFAVIAGVVGARLQLEVALILGVANLVADGFSMAVSNFFRSKSDQEIIEKARQMEKKHIELIPEGEKEEVRQIFKAKGFEGVTLDNIVKTITSDEKRWIDTMLVEELGLRIENPHPLKSALATFISFCFVGVIPLLPLLASYFIEIPKIYTVSAVMTFITFYLLGYFKGRYLDLGHPPLISGFETLFLGGGAATLAYAIGHFIKMIL